MDLSIFNQSRCAYSSGIAILAIAMVGIIDMIFATPCGLGLGSDAVVHLISAHIDFSGEELGLTVAFQAEDGLILF